MDDIVIRGGGGKKKKMVLKFQKINFQNKAMLSTDEFTIYFLINKNNFHSNLK